MPYDGLTRQQMMRVIQDEGGSVLYQGRVLTKVDELPSEAELAQGDPVAAQAAAAGLEAQIVGLRAQLAQLQVVPPSPTAPTDPTHYQILADFGDWKQGQVIAAEVLGDEAARLLKAKKIAPHPVPDGEVPGK